ncbi:MAG: hypothetical protein JNK05_14555 [Myxococcales bacterium]|nr:hypothetical protein [Myxococcales bacterium]
MSGVRRMGASALGSSLVVVFCASCATTNAQQNRSSDELSRESEAAARAEGSRATREQQERGVAALRALLARESSATLSERSFEAGEDFRGSVASAGDVTVSRIEGAYTVRFSIGTTQPVDCFVFDRPADLANAIRTMYERLRRDFVRSAILSTDAGFVSNNPFVEASVLYTVNAGGRIAPGSVKIRSLTSGERSVVCVHDEPGYRATFHRALTPLFRNGTRSARDANYVASLNDHNVGVMMLRFREEGEVTTEVTLDSMLLTRGEADLTSIDKATIEQYSRAGALASQREVENENSTVSDNQWEREASTLRYSFAGTHLGRPLRGVVTAHEELRAGTPTVAAFARRALSSASGSVAPLEYERFNHSNPLTVRRDRIELDRREDGTRVWLNLVSAQRTLRVLMNADGLPDEIQMQVGRVMLRMRRSASQ